MDHTEFKYNLLSEGKSQGISYIENTMCSPKGEGQWALSTCHLEGKTPVPRLWRDWLGSYLIQDALTLADYSHLPPVKKGGERGPLPITLLWYPRQASDIVSDWMRESVGPAPSITDTEFIYGPSEPSEATPIQAKPAGHKRQISEAIPSNERVNNSQQEEDQEGGQEGGQEGTRKSGRARKPRVRN